MKKYSLLFLGIFILFGLNSCEKEEELAEFNSDLFIQNFADKMVLPCYQNLNSNAQLMYANTIVFCNNPSDSLLQVLKLNWFSTREKWELTEAFLFGPVSTLEIDPSLDDWPLNYIDLDSLMNQSVVLSTSFVSDLPTSLKGFHAIEYLLFGRNSHKTVSEFKPRELEYLLSLTDVLSKSTQQLLDAWSPQGNTYYQTWTTAGKGSTIYQTQQLAALELLTAIAGIVDEVGAGKLSEPFLAADSTLDESNYSKNSFTDFTNNIIGAKNAYLCQLNGQTGMSLGQFIHKYNKSLHFNIIQRFDDIIANLKSYKVPFSQAIFTNPAQLESTIKRFSELSDILSNQAQPVILQHFQK